MLNLKINERREVTVRMYGQEKVNCVMKYEINIREQRRKKKDRKTCGVRQMSLKHEAIWKGTLSSHQSEMLPKSETNHRRICSPCPDSVTAAFRFKRNPTYEDVNAL